MTIPPVNRSLLKMGPVERIGMPMCKTCDELDAQMARYLRLAKGVMDDVTREAANKNSLRN